MAVFNIFGGHVQLHILPAYHLKGRVTTETTRIAVHTAIMHLPHVDICDEKCCPGILISCFNKYGWTLFQKQDTV